MIFFLVFEIYFKYFFNVFEYITLKVFFNNIFFNLLNYIFKIYFTDLLIDNIENFFFLNWVEF